MYPIHELALELKIRAAEREFAKHGTREKWRILKDLLGQRSPHRVAEMEHQRGLR